MEKLNIFLVSVDFASRKRTDRCNLDFYFISRAYFIQIYLAEKLRSQVCP